MLSARYLSITITKHLFGGVYCNVIPCKNSYPTSIISWQQNLSDLNSYNILYGINKFPFGLMWYAKITNHGKTPTKMPHTGHWMNEQLNENLNDILLIWIIDCRLFYIAVRDGIFWGFAWSKIYILTKFDKNKLLPLSFLQNNYVLPIHLNNSHYEHAKNNVQCLNWLRTIYLIPSKYWKHTAVVNMAAHTTLCTLKWYYSRGKGILEFKKSLVLN